MLVKALKSFTTADLKLSLGVGYINEIENEELANQLIADGFVEKYEEINPNGEINITQNGNIDVSKFKTAKVNCGQYIIKLMANNDTQQFFNISVVKGDSINLDEELNSLSRSNPFMVPESKELIGFATESNKEEPDAAGNIKPTGNMTLYAVWGDTE